MSERGDVDETRPSPADAGGRPAAAGRTAGSHIGPFTIESELGRGGMGVVYRAHDTALGRSCALKVITPALAADERFRSRFQHEARAAASVDNPNVIGVYQAGEADGSLFLAMRLIDGPDLGRLVAAQGPLDPDRAAQLILQVASGLDAAHEAGLIHRDIKPGNILIERGSSDHDHVFVTDFGISRSLRGSSFTETSELLGSADYVAPEQIEAGAIDRRVDIYALGGVAFLALTGKPPYADVKGEIPKLMAHQQSPPPRASDVRPGLGGDVDRVIAKAMAKNPDDRYDTAGELAADLAAVLSPDFMPTRPLDAEGARRAAADGRRRRSRFRFLKWAIPVLLVLLLVAAAAVWWSQREDPVTEPEVAAGVTDIPIPAPASDVSVGPNVLWLSSRRGEAVYGVNRLSLEVVRNIPLAAPVASITNGLDSVWITTPAEESLRFYLGPPTFTFEAIPIDSAANSVLTDGRRVWTLSTEERLLTRVDPETKKVDGTVELNGNPVAFAGLEGRIWTVTATGVLNAVDPVSMEVVGPSFRVNGRPADIIAAGGILWISDERHGWVTRFDPGSGEVLGEPIPVGSTPRGMASGLGSLWVANAGDGTVSRINMQTGEAMGEPIVVGGRPIELAVSEAVVWVVDGRDPMIRRIDVTALN